MAQPSQEAVNFQQLAAEEDRVESLDLIRTLSGMLDELSQGYESYLENV